MHCRLKRTGILLVLLERSMLFTCRIYRYYKTTTVFLNFHCIVSVIINAIKFYILMFTLNNSICIESTLTFSAKIYV